MAAIADGIAMGAATTAQQHRGRLTQTQLVGHATAAQVSTVTEPAVPAAAAGAELVHTSGKLQRLRACGGVRVGDGVRISHGG